MKIIEKKCPNCGANLDFKVGERDIACQSCRRKFAIEYNHDEDLSQLKQSAIDALSARDFSLTAADKRRAKVALIIIAILVIVGAAVAIISAIRFQQDEQARKEEYNKTVEEMDQKAKERQQEMEEEYNKRVEEMKNK